MKIITAPLLVSAALAVIGSFTQVKGHSWLVKPVSRETDAVGDDGTNSMGCPTMKAGKSTSFKAGETIDVRYWRNNHIGGFIRWSLVPKGKETKVNLDKSENIFHYSCRESGPECVPKEEYNQNNVYADDDSPEHTIPCGDKITLPDHLPAGDYVLQWTWFGVGSTFNDIAREEHMFRSCADIKLTTKGSKSAAPKCPTFTGGDRVTKMKNMGNDKCFYFYRNEIANTVFKGNKADYEQYYKFGIPGAIEKCSGGGSASNSTTPAPSSSTSKPSAATVTPGTKTPGTETRAPAATTTAPGMKSPIPTRTPRPRPSSTRTPKPTSDEVDGDADTGNEDNEDDKENNDNEDNEDNEDTDNVDDESGDEGKSDAAGIRTPRPASKIPDCKVKNAKK